MGLSEDPGALLIVGGRILESQSLSKDRQVDVIRFYGPNQPEVKKYLKPIVDSWPLNVSRCAIVDRPWSSLQSTKRKA